MYVLKFETIVLIHYLFKRRLSVVLYHYLNIVRCAFSIIIPSTYFCLPYKLFYISYNDTIITSPYNKCKFSLRVFFKKVMYLY